MSNYENLDIWKLSVNFCTEIFIELEENTKINTKYGFKDQLERSILSIPSNIAEGSGRSTTKDFLHFLYIARGSISEAQTQILIAKKIGYFSEERYLTYKESLELIHKKLNGLIRSLHEKL